MLVLLLSLVNFVVLLYTLYSSFYYHALVNKGAQMFNLLT